MAETIVLATFVARRIRVKASTSCPLTVDYQEKTYAAGAFPAAISSARTSDREGDAGLPPDRPSDPSAVRRRLGANETQVIVTVLSHDMENDPDILALVARSAALDDLRVPVQGPIGAARVGFANDEYVLNPTLDEMLETQLDLVVAGTADAVLDGGIGSQGTQPKTSCSAPRDVRPPSLPAVIKAIIELAAEGRQRSRAKVEAVVDESVLEKEMLGLIEQGCARPTPFRSKQGPLRRVGSCRVREV